MKLKGLHYFTIEEEQPILRFLYSIKPSWSYYIRNKDKGCHLLANKMSQVLYNIDNRATMVWDNASSVFHYVCAKTVIQDDISMKDIENLCKKGIEDLPLKIKFKVVGEYEFCEKDLKNIKTQIQNENNTDNQIDSLLH